MKASAPGITPRAISWSTAERAPARGSPDHRAGISPPFPVPAGCRRRVPDLKTLLETLLDLSAEPRASAPAWTAWTGPGSMAWAGPVAVEATVAGMLAALAEKPAPCRTAAAVGRAFQALSCCLLSGRPAWTCVWPSRQKPFHPEARSLPLLEDRIRSTCRNAGGGFGRL
ncbi:MAG: hypothetical protein MZV70_56195 [Desulfobacterales bacterium]|nr:hypothetical protein [Desulfobacterales bacterium]